MSLHLVTGYAGEAHITSADQGAYNMATYGEGEFVLNRGNKFVTTVVSNNSITVADGEAMMQGRYIKMIPGTSETVSIDNGTTGMKRNDLICLRYEKSSNTGIETATIVVIKGTEDATTPADPDYTHGDITDGTDLVNEMPLYRVCLDGLSIDSVTALFSVKVSMVDYMDDYQLPAASANALGGVKMMSDKSNGVAMSGDYLYVPVGYGLTITSNDGVKLDTIRYAYSVNSSGTNTSSYTVSPHTTYMHTTQITTTSFVNFMKKNGLIILTNAAARGWTSNGILPIPTAPYTSGSGSNLKVYIDILIANLTDSNVTIPANAGWTIWYTQLGS